MRFNLLSQIQHWQRWWLPATCVLCGQSSEGELALCSGCETDLPQLEPVCSSCALPLPVGISKPQLCGHCLKHPPAFTQIRALFQYREPWDRLIVGLKFNGQLHYAHLLGSLLVKAIQQDWYANDVLPECIIPMPLHPRRLQERGFNQAVELARPIGKILGLPVDFKSCRRVRNTPAQTILPAAQRRKNVKNAFEVSSTFCAKHVAIVDDVVTTGHTVTELSCELRKGGVERIDVWCCARTNLLAG